MKAIGKATVVYAGLELMPDSADEHCVGECSRRGSLDLVVNGEVIESYVVGVGWQVCVADGATVDAGTTLFVQSFVRSFRARLPAGTTARVKLPDARHLQHRVDEVTGLGGLLVEPSDGVERVAVELVDDTGRVLASVDVEPGAALRVTDGARVVSGAVIATVFVDSPRAAASVEQPELRRMLDAKSPSRFVVASAPFDGVVVAVTDRHVTIRSEAGTSSRLRLRWRGAAVRAGDRVRAGHAMESSGDRSHHRLLRAWGAHRLAEHMVDEFEAIGSAHRAKVPSVYWSLAVRSMLRWRRVVAPGDTGLARNAVLALEALDVIQRDTAARGGEIAVVKPVLRGFRAMASG